MLFVLVPGVCDEEKTLAELLTFLEKFKDCAPFGVERPAAALIWLHDATRELNAAFFLFLGKEIFENYIFTNY